MTMEEVLLSLGAMTTFVAVVYLLLRYGRGVE